MSVPDIAAARRRIAALVAHLARQPGDPVAAYEAADLAIDHGLEELAVAAVARAAPLNAAEPRLWQMLGLLHRGLEQSDEAIRALGRAAQLAPADLRIAHALALVMLEAGAPAIEAYDRALRLGPLDGTLLLGRTSAQLAARQGDVMLAELAALLRDNPGWIAGHYAFAKSAATLGQADRVTETLDAALARHPADLRLHHTRLAVLGRSVPPGETLRAIAAVRQRVGDPGVFRLEEAIATSEQGDIARAGTLFRALGPLEAPSAGLAFLRHLIQARQFDRADTQAARLIDGPEAITAWAYRRAAWAMTGDSRLAWLEQNGALVRSFDMADTLPPLDSLAQTLRAIHVGEAQPLDQSVRGGTQTDGPLFARIEPDIRATRSAIRAIVARYMAELPPIDPAHPLLSAPRGTAPRFVGSWSVRLRGSGHHVSHIHGAGWLSSALYVALPEGGMAGGGQLTIGAPPPDLGLDLAPLRTIAPKPGRLVLFPSYTWHGVTPFAAGERLTIAFDVGRPRG